MELKVPTLPMTQKGTSIILYQTFEWPVALMGDLSLAAAKRTGKSNGAGAIAAL